MDNPHPLGRLIVRVRDKAHDARAMEKTLTEALSSKQGGAGVSWR